MAARSSRRGPGSLGLVASLVDRAGRVFRLLLVAHWELARDEAGRESGRAARISRWFGLALGFLFFGALLLQAALVWFVIDATDLPPAAVLAGGGLLDLALGLLCFRLGARVIEERRFMEDTRARVGDTLEILRG